MLVCVNVKFHFNIRKKYIEAANENLRIWTKLGEVARGHQKMKGEMFVIVYFRPNVCRVKKNLGL